jgi:Nucleotidyl transferase AbiEii toxin, Type IV TA system
VNIVEHLHLFRTGFPTDPESAVRRGITIGLRNRMMCEVSAWCWELDEQVRGLAADRGLRVALMGGTAAQLRLEISEQRGSADDDYLTDATSAEIADLMVALAERFADSPEPFFRPEKKVPRTPTPGLDLLTYEVPVPSLLGHTDTSGHAKHIVKLEFHFTRTMPPTETVTAEVFALADPITSTIPILAHQIALKLLALAAEPIGIPQRREHDIPKQIYDIDRLLQHLNGQRGWSGLHDAIHRVATDEATKVGLEDDPTSVVAGIVARLDHWARVTDDSHLKELTRNAGALTGQAHRVGAIGWRARARRIQYALHCAREPAGHELWETARADGMRLSLDPSSAWREISTRWRAERVDRPPPWLKAYPTELLFEYLATAEHEPRTPKVGG